MSERGLDDRLAAIVARVLGHAARVDGIVALEGVSHRSYGVKTDRGAFAVKLRAEGAADVLSLEQEHRVQERAAAAGLAPEPVGYDASAGALVTRYIEGATAPTPERVREPPMLERIAALLSDLHGLPAEGLEPFGAAAHARRYLAAARAVRALDDRDERLGAELLELAEGNRGLAPISSPAPSAPIAHADLVAGNILEADNRLLLIDFEYACAADPILDLASLAAMNDLTSAQSRTLLEAYAGATGRPPYAESDFAKVVRLMNLLAYFWAEAEAARTGSRAALDEYRRRERLIKERDEQ